ncbi:TnsA endonuclease N-terminal domain-containing protein [Undibacterium sp.]|uniref:TnsA endonuclease N-terminal domain-containing protein n=1 Tax=Undibacterium sp. TaxID=1914977 RepID=UPI0025FC4394|nr:TnsA endonuclease N-terminal domain-containing protein [Undibacterium sp.]
MRGRRFKTQEDIEKYIRQGCGQGEGVAYQPWIRVQDIPSRGRSRKVHGIKVDRVYHVLSDAEFLYLLLLEFSDKVVDIREQFPIFPTEEAQRIAAELGIRYPRYHRTTLLFVMTTDFLITYVDAQGKHHLAARTLKLDEDLIDSTTLKRRLEKFELEKRILASQGIEDWGIITPNIIGEIPAHNLKWLYAGVNIERQFDRAEIQHQFLESLQYFMHHERTLASLIRTAAKAMHLPYVDGVKLFKYLAWNKAIQFDIANHELHMNQPCPSLQIVGLKKISTFLKAA